MTSKINYSKYEDIYEDINKSISKDVKKIHIDYDTYVTTITKKIVSERYYPRKSLKIIYKELQKIIEILE